MQLPAISAGDPLLLCPYPAIQSAVEGEVAGLVAIQTESELLWTDQTFDAAWERSRSNRHTPQIERVQSSPTTLGGGGLGMEQQAGLGEELDDPEYRNRDQVGTDRQSRQAEVWSRHKRFAQRAKTALQNAQRII
jgi:hypothetical protein